MDIEFTYSSQGLDAYNENVVSPAEKSEHASRVSPCVLQFDHSCPQTHTTKPHDLSDESGIEDPDLIRNIPLVEEKGDEVMRRLCDDSAESNDSGLGNPDSTNITPSLPLPVVPYLINKSLSEKDACVTMETGLCDQGHVVQHDDTRRTRGPSMKCFQSELPVLTTETPLSVETANSEDCPMISDSGEPVTAEGLNLCMDVAWYEDVDLTSAVSSVSDVKKSYEVRKEAVDCVDSAMMSGGNAAPQGFSQRNDLCCKNGSKKFLTKFNKFVKKFNAKEVNCQQSRPECKVIMEENLYQRSLDFHDYCANPHKNQPCKHDKSALSRESKDTKRDPPLCPKRTSTVLTGTKIDIICVTPVYFSPKNLYQMFINAYWREHATSHSEKALVLREAEALWNSKYSKNVDPKRVRVLQFLDRHNALMEDHRKSREETDGKQSADLESKVRSHSHVRSRSPVRSHSRVRSHSPDTCRSRSPDRSRSPVRRRTSVDSSLKTCSFNQDKKGGSSEDYRANPPTHQQCKSSRCSKPTSTKRNLPLSPQTKVRVHTERKVDTDHIPPIYFVPQNLYQSFINAYWTEHANDHPKKALVLREAETLWKSKFSKNVDPERVRLLQFLDRHSAQTEDHCSMYSAAVEDHHKSATEDPRKSRPKRKRVSNTRYDSNEYAMGDTSDLEESEEEQNMITEETPDDPNLWSEKQIDCLYRDWRPPADVDVGRLLSSCTLLMSLKHKVLELLRIVFAGLEYPPRLITSVTALTQTLDRIEAAVTGARLTENTCLNISGNTECWVVICRDPMKCLKQLRGRVCDFLSVILPDLSLDGSFDRSSDAVEGLLDEIITSNKQAT